MISTASSSLPRLPLWATRTAWIAIVLAYLAFFFTDLSLDFQQVIVPCSGPTCNYLAISQSEFDTLASWGLTPMFYAGFIFGVSTLSVGIATFLGLLIFWRQGQTAIGWVISLVLVIMPIASIADPDNVGAAYPALVVPSLLLSMIGFIVVQSTFFLFPNGRFYPKPARYVWAANTIVSLIYILSFYGYITMPDWYAPFGTTLFISFLLLAGILQILRFRYDATPVERQQTKWILMGILVLISGFPIWFIVFAGGVTLAPGQVRLLAKMVGWFFSGITITALPVSIAIAIQRYRIWDIDLVIRRTLQYALLTGLIVLFYFGGVVLLQGILTPLLGESNSPLVTVISTLTIAALFNPLRVRIQAFIDRRFYRAHYDAERALAAFSGAARDEVDLERLGDALLSVTHETMQPKHASLWIEMK